MGLVMIKGFFTTAVIALISFNCFALPEPQDKDVYNTFSASLKNRLVESEMNALHNGKNSFVLSEYFLNPLSDSYIYSEYKNNEILANKKYKNKEIRIVAVAESISEDFTGQGIIRTLSPEVFSGSAILNIDKNDKYILSLSSGDRIDMVCKGGGFVMGSPVLNDCVSTRDFVIKHMGKGEIRDSLENLIDGVSYVLYTQYFDIIGNNCKSRVECESFISNIFQNKITAKSLGLDDEEKEKRLMSLFVFINKHEKELNDKYPHASKVISGFIKAK